MKIETTREAVEAQIERLRSVNKRLMDGEKLIMRVPGDFERDMDLIIAQSMDMLDHLCVDRDAAVARAEAAEKKRDALQIRLDAEAQVNDEAVKRAEALKAERDAAREALKPFASHLGKDGERVTLSIGKDTWTGTLTTADFAAARTALASGEKA